MNEWLALISQKEEADEAESDDYLIEITTHIREDQAWALEILVFFTRAGTWREFR